MRALLALFLISALGGCASLTTHDTENESPPTLNYLAHDDSSAQTVTTPLTAPVILIAALPFQNLSGRPAPLAELREMFINALEEKGLRFLDDDTLEDFMRRHRIRYTGGISGRTAELLKKEIGADAVLITFMELYKEEKPPKIAVASRLVLSGKNPQILWMESSAMTGDESPGLLGLGLIKDRKKLVEKALQPLIDSLVRYMAGEPQETDYRREDVEETPLTYYVPGQESGKMYSRYVPKAYYRSFVLEDDRKYTVAIAPFYNDSGRKGAGQIMAFDFVEQLLKIDAFDVIEPGVVRQELLKYRVILDGGISLSDADVLFDKLGADLVVSGRVFDYQGFLGVPKVDFSVEFIERSSLRTVWSSRSYNSGDEGVFFFDAGRVHTAHTLVSKMVQEVTGKLIGR